MEKNNIIEDKEINIYKEIHDVLITRDAEVSKYFIMSYYQTIPRYYLLCNDNGINSCIYNFSVGSGKTAAALFVALNNIDIYRKYLFNKQFMPKTIDKNLNIELNKNVFVIGSWVTTSAILNELMREDFGFVTKDEINTINKLMNSNILENRKKGEHLKQKIQSKIQKYINFYGYQAFVNVCFPNLSSEAISQDAEILINNYQKGLIDIDSDFKKKLRNSIIIVDECQKLYSINGINSYGFTIMCINKLAEELNIKMVFLSGTLFNTSLSELLPVVNIMTEHREDTYKGFKTKKGIFNEDECLEDINIEGVAIKAPTKKFLEAANELLSSHYILYDHNRSQKVTEKYKGEISMEGGITKEDIKKDIMDKIVTLKFPNRKNLPQECHIGNIKVNNKKGDTINMLLYSCEVSGFQKEQYKKYLQNNSYNELDIDDENETTISIHDVGFPPQNEFIKNSIIKNSNNEYMGKFLELNNLKNFSAIGYNMVKICIEKVLNKEKLIIYHNKLQSFGLYQYMLILNVNGFVKYGDSPKSNSLCKHCGKPYILHNEDLNERLKQKVCNDFLPIYYYYLIGDMKQSERDEIVNSVYNNPKNEYGDLLSIMFVSDVAYSGISFMNTNNIIILSKISNISKWRQICARIIRTHSHDALPKQRRYANVYTMVIHYPDETKVFKTKYTYEQKYYILRTILNETIDEYINSLENKTIGYKLFNEPEKIKSSEKEQKKIIEMYSNDIKKNINNIIEKYVLYTPAKIWKLNTFLDRIKDDKESYTFFNLSKISNDYLLSILSLNNSTNIFSYNSDNSKELYIQFISNNFKKSTTVTTFSYLEIENIPKDKTILYSLLKRLEVAELITQKRNILIEIIKFVGKDYDLLVNQHVFWSAIYDIHDEYYEDDETNFFENHCSKNRNINKMVGFYNNEYIIMKDGTTKRINLTFPSYNGWEKIPLYFKITCLMITQSSPFYLHLSIFKKQKEHADGRRVSKGVTCISYDFKEIFKYFKLDPNKYTNKADACLVLMQLLVDKQYENMDDRNVFTPFEK